MYYSVFLVGGKSTTAAVEKSENVDGERRERGEEERIEEKAAADFLFP